MGFKMMSPAAPAKGYKLPEKFTQEQQAIIDSDARLVVGQALAGTGKSTTGLGYAAARPSEKILVLCFNRANAKEAQFKYPFVSKNAKVKTVHSVAYDELDPALRHRVAQRWTSVVVRRDLVQLGVRPDLRTSAIAMSILFDFFIADDKVIDAFKHGNAAIERHGATSSELERSAGFAKRLWAAMQSVEPVSGMRGDVNPIKIPHDAYLKMFSLKNRKLGYDTIIFDEAQDANPVMLRILHNQYHAGAKLIFLGDEHQSIYDFRGAVNGMRPENMPATPVVYPLTQSWRMGPKSASIANILLKDLKGDRLRIDAQGSDQVFDESAPRTLLARLNATLISAAVDARGKGVCWIGGIESYRIDMLLDGWNLRIGNRDDVKDYVMKDFLNYEELEEAAKYDAEMGIVKRLVEEYQQEIPSIVSDLRKNAVDRQSEASLVLSTVHKAKGLEWDYVELAEDFRGSLKDAEDWLQGKGKEFPEQEINLLYVASTRAKKALKINEEMYLWLSNLDHYRAERTRSWSNNCAITSSFAASSNGISSKDGRESKPIGSGDFAKLAAFTL